MQARIALLASGAAVVSAAVTKIKLGQDIDYPPYAFKDANGTLQGFGKDIADGMTAMCEDLEIDVVQTSWSDCWDGDGPTIGAKLKDGTLDACTTYTHTKGIRNEFLDFSGGILQVNKAAGLLTLLDPDGNPKVKGCSDLAGVTVADVAGWAPTADTIAFVMNKCSKTTYSKNYTMKSAAEETVDGVKIGPNDKAMMMLRAGEAHAVFLYADQAKNYQCKQGVTSAWNCTLWNGFGTDYAYVQTGQFGYVFNGTTLAITKKGSGVAEKLNPCLYKYMETKGYYDVCVKHDMVDTCYHNSHFPSKDSEKIHEYNLDTDQHKGDCSNGYCPCTGTCTEKGGNSAVDAAVVVTLSSVVALPILSLF